MINTRMVKECGACTNTHRGHCVTYPNPSDFIRQGSQFRCPVKGYSELTNSKPKTKVRVGQQKQRKG